MTKRSLSYEFNSLRTETLLQTWLCIFVSLRFRVLVLLHISCSSGNILSLELVSFEERQNIAFLRFGHLGLISLMLLFFGYAG